MKIFPASLLALVFLSSPVGPLAAGETGVSSETTPTKPAIGYSGEQTVDRPAATAAIGTNWFSEARFGMFIHWGLYAVTEGEWRGKKVPYIGEWIMHEEKIPIADYLERKVKPQLREILTNYGPIGMIWLDTPTKSLSREQAKEIKALVKELQPDCLVSARIGHGLGDLDGRGQVIGDWAREFGLTATQQGELLGVGLWPFAASIVAVSLVADLSGVPALKHFCLIDCFRFSCSIPTPILTLGGRSLSEAPRSPNRS